MKKVMLTVLLLIASYFGICFYFSIADAKKSSEFESVCKDANEKIYQHKVSGKIAIEYRPVSGVIEQKYYPIDLAKQLLNDPDRFEMVQLLFSSDDLDPKRPKNKEYCYGDFVISAVKEDQLKIGLCGMVNGKEHYWEKQNSENIADYVIKYKYGTRNEYDIRPVKFYIEERKSGQVIAEQNSFQLLLGRMSESKNRVWLGWGTAEGARNCSLTEAKSFVVNAVNPNG